jgi:hypothetical protein
MYVRIGANLTGKLRRPLGAHWRRIGMCAAGT